MPERITESAVLEQVTGSGFDVVDRIVLAGREATRLPVPACLDPTLRAHLESLYPQGLYSHQARALDLLRDADVGLATSTASDKSLVFMSAALDLLLRDPTARVLALYPSKALIQDQPE